MSYSKAPHSSTRPRWPVALLVITGVSAVSVALGLTVVGPMIQRSRETPPPALRAAAPPAVAAAPPAEPAAEVEIKERVIPHPKPRPAIAADVLDGSGSPVVPDSSQSAPTPAVSPGSAGPDASLAPPAGAPA